MILIINPGSSSIKYSVFLESGKKLLEKNILNIKDFEKNFIEKIENNLKKENFFDKIKKIGFRIVHGGTIFTKTTEIDANFIKKFTKIIDLAPIHNSFALKCIKNTNLIFKNIKKYAVFDTEFHKNIPEINKLYSIPQNISKKYNIFKYGFHGLSYEFLKNKLEKIENISTKNIILCHLGSGSSICSLKNGKVFDISMGFSPNSGLTMSTRSGDIGSGAIFHLLKNCKMSLNELENILNKKSGILGLSGEKDMKIMLEKAQKGNKNCILAEKIFINSVKKYIGSFVAGIGGIDILVFSGGIGENSFYLRDKICEDLDFLNLFLDKKKNLKNEEGLISKGKSKKIFILKTDEQKMIFEKI